MTGIRADVKEIEGEYQIAIYDDKMMFAFMWADRIEFNGVNEIAMYRQNQYVGKVPVRWLSNN